jgi:hypothetical protein
MEIITLISGVIAFFMIIGFFVMVSNTTDIKNAAINSYNVLREIHLELIKQRQMLEEHEAKKIVKPGESIEL